MRKEIDEIKSTLQESVIKLDKEYSLRFDMIKYIDDQKTVFETIKRSSEEVVKIIKNLEQDKKISLFAMNPVKEILKKIDDLMVQNITNQGHFYAKHKQEWDEAAYRLKRRPSIKDI